MKIASACVTAALTAAAVVISAATAYADEPPPTDRDNPMLIDCPDQPSPDDPFAAIPPRAPQCGEDDWEIWPGIHLRSNAYRRVSTVYGPDGSMTLIGSTHFQLRDRDGNLVAGEPGSTLHHVPFGREIPPPPPETLREDLTPHEQAVQEGVSRVTVGIMDGVTYTGDLTDMSAFLTTPIGSLVVQAPGTGPERTQPGPHGERQLQFLNTFQVLDSQGRYVMGNTLTLGSPMALWPNAAVPCPLGTVPISQVSKEKLISESASGAAVSTQDLPDPVCKAPASVPIRGYDAADGDNPNSAAIQRQKDINDAYSAVGTQFGLAVAVGGLIGGITGLTVGCIIGAFGGAAEGSLSSIPGTAAGGFGGCVVGAGLLGGMGGTIGSLVLGVPVGIASGVNAYNTLRLQGDVSQQITPRVIAPMVETLFLGLTPAPAAS